MLAGLSWQRRVPERAPRDERLYLRVQVRASDAAVHQVLPALAAVDHRQKRRVLRERAVLHVRAVPTSRARGLPAHGRSADAAEHGPVARSPQDEPDSVLAAARVLRAVQRGALLSARL
eukprot:Amastigsp_a843552_63.p5 type:complete len:119 gc:universal Amastigsp_a843552_63:979-1335(+)